MEAALALGLMLQAVALSLIFLRLRGAWLTHLGAVFVVLAVTYHGLNELFLWISPGYDPYRILVQVAHVDEFVLFVSVAILLFTFGYLACLTRGTTTLEATQFEAHPAAIARVFDWRIMVLAAIPLMIITLGGQYAPNGNLQNQSLGFAFGLSTQFFLIALVLASFGFVVRFGIRWLLPVLVVQSALVAAIGQRGVILFGAALLMYALRRCGMTPRRRQLVIGALAAIALTLTVTSARAVQGRLPTTSGDSLRVQFLFAGLGQIGSSAAWHQVAVDLGYRFDGNSFGAMELQALDSGARSLGVTPLKNDVLLAIPSFLNPSKVSADRSSREEKLYAEEHLGLFGLQIVPGVWVDILPTQLGSLTGIFGPSGMIVVALFLGAFFALADRWLLRSVTPARLLIGLGLLNCALDYEGSWDVYTTTFRGILVLLVIVLVLKGLLQSLAGVTQMIGSQGVSHNS